MSQPTTTASPDATTGQETDAADTGYVPVELAGYPVRALVSQRWRASHLRALNAGDLDRFAEGVLHPDDVDAWYAADPTQDEIGDWVRAVAEASGEALGKSSGRPASSKITRKR
ncbi:hypothetical protein [Streptomyces hiroshimensis]|uniref:Uncharacterized protein n=1 Tax=Streptomyces hiroshimensis TaxID=66424 RepID=A0ABQ2Y4K9_9ACTN|nr:hypothetical protein [Streptomyces hiroshimensis]GGX63192.1 hypothetical protein GCM10010324_04930 [Streptomyces hiroshimensis]